MTITLNMKGQERKTLVAAIAEITGEKPKYMGMPSVAYKIGSFTVTKEGNIDTGETEESVTAHLMRKLFERCFPVEIDAIQQEEEVEEEAEEADEPAEPSGTAIQMPLSQFSEKQLNNLYALVDAKSELMKNAFNTEKLPIQIIGNRLDFAWFPKESTPEELNAYMHFITALCDMAKRQKRIMAKAGTVENEKYAFRCFLLRLGFIGEEYRDDRKILLKNLSGSAAFKNR